MEITMSNPYFDGLSYHPTSEEIVNILATKTQNQDSKLYFRVLTSYYLCQMASSMHVNILTKDRGELPINMYAVALATSGFGKGFSKNIIEENIVNQFKSNFLNFTFPEIAEQSMQDTAAFKANMSNGKTEQDFEYEKLHSEFIGYGNMPYSFDSGTAPAFKEIRTKAQIAKIGALNLEIDEIGTNLLANADLFGVCLEAYDKGLIKQKIIKNTHDNKRAEERAYPIPVNLLLFGTPSKLFNGGKEESEFYALLDTGFARRCLFALGIKIDVSKRMSAIDRFKALTSVQNATVITRLSKYFGRLANAINYKKVIDVSESLSIELIEYQINCELRAEEFPEHEEIRKAEMEHRYFKAIKLAGAYAFIDGTVEVTKEQLMNAIKLIEASGEAFSAILTRDKNYVKLAKYVSSVGREVTHADLTEDLPFYRGTMSNKQDLLQLASAWGYPNNIIIKTYTRDDIEFIKGESLKECNLDEMIFSLSKSLAIGYQPLLKPFDKLHLMTQANGLHWVNHHMLNQHRTEENAIQGFNMIVIDVDKGISLETAKLLLRKYKALYYTTKRHQKLEGTLQHGDRFRIILPIKYLLKLTATDFTEFMLNIFEWLPFQSDDQTAQRSRKWEACNSSFSYVEGEILDPMQFIPKTTKNEARKKANKKMTNATKTEKWFAERMAEGDRNNTLLKYAMMLLDSGVAVGDVQTKILKFNSKLTNPLLESEIIQTIMVTVASKATKVTA